MEQRETGTETKAEIAVNRTGIMTNPELSAELITGALQTVPSSQGDGSALASLRQPYLQKRAAVGSPPVVLEVSEDGVTLGPLESMTVLLDKLGERLAFERQGARLYQAVIQKCEMLGEEEAAAPIEELRRICDEELEHFRMLQRAITRLGGDATVKTPSADIAGIMSKGVLEIACDPRASIAQSLQALLTAELVDNDGWEMLQELAAELAQDDLEAKCSEALEQEQEHLDKIREWLTGMVMDSAIGTEDLLDDLEGDTDQHQGNASVRRGTSKRSKTKTSKRSAKKKKR